MSDPDFIIIGSQKAGTTSAGVHLSQHPLVRVIAEELHFFDRTANFKRGMEWYRNRIGSIRRKNKSLVAERTPAYMYYPEGRQRLLDQYSESQVKFLVFLRNPIARAYSAWNMHQTNHQRNHPGECPKGVPFEKCALAELQRLAARDLRYANTDFIHRGFYAEQLAEIFERVPRERIKVVIAERVLTNPVEAYNDIFQWLGVPKHTVRFKSGVHKRKYKKQMTPEMRKKLQAVLAPHVDHLRKLLDDPIPEWSKDWPEDEDK